MTKLIERLQHQPLIEALKTRRVVLLTGARQCGKTTLSKELKILSSTYRTLDEETFRKSALYDPEGFVVSDYQTMIIDEIQRAPSLLIAIKKVVDEKNTYGQFLITGSANLSAMPSVHESLAGRIQKIRLRTLTQTEIASEKSDFLKMAFAQNFKAPVICENKAAILEYCFRGGYPEVLTMTQRNRRSWHNDYMDALLSRDLQDIAKIHKFQAMGDLVKILCAWTGKLLDMSALGSNLAISRMTLEAYFNALEILFVVERVSPWIKVDYQRVGRQPKLFLTDSGLICSLLRWQYDQVLLDSDRAGKIFETFIFNELAALVDASLGEFALYHYRDREGREVDFIIEKDDGSVLGIEVKAGSSVGQGDFKHLLWLQKTIKHPFVGIVLYSGSHVLPFGKNLWAVPMASIWRST